MQIHRHLFLEQLWASDHPSRGTNAFLFILKQGQHMSVVYEEPNSPRPDRLYHGRVQVVEVKEKHVWNGSWWSSLFSEFFQAIIILDIFYEF